MLYHLFSGEGAHSSLSGGEMLKPGRNAESRIESPVSALAQIGMDNVLWEQASNKLVPR
jgi:hypothetical protein